MTLKEFASIHNLKPNTVARHMLQGYCAWPRRYRNNKSKHPLYTTWCAMKARCHNSNATEYKNYGGRGITVCTEWRLSFETFIKDMGERPSTNHTLDRIDNDGIYCKENCRWATWKQQQENRDMSYRNKSGQVGVHYHKRDRVWISRITIDKKVYTLGYFKTFKEAQEVRQASEGKTT